MTEPEDDQAATITRVLERTGTIAVVGASPRAGRPSHGVTRMLIDRGYTVVPVNPNATEVHGRTCYPDLASIPDEVEIDLVDIFRRPEAAGAHVDEAIALGVPAVWMQIGVVDEAAAARARAAGLDVVMDRCVAVELGRLEQAPDGSA